MNFFKRFDNKELIINFWYVYKDLMGDEIFIIRVRGKYNILFFLIYEFILKVCSWVCRFV